MRKRKTKARNSSFYREKTYGKFCNPGLQTERDNQPRRTFMNPVSKRIRSGTGSNIKDFKQTNIRKSLNFKTIFRKKNPSQDINTETKIHHSINCSPSLTLHKIRVSPGTRYQYKRLQMDNYFRGNKPSPTFKTFSQRSTTKKIPHQLERTGVLFCDFLLRHDK